MSSNECGRVPKKSTARDPQRESLDDVLSFLCGEKQEKSASRPGWDCCRSLRRLQAGILLVPDGRGATSDAWLLRGVAACCAPQTKFASEHCGKHAWSDITPLSFCALSLPCLSSHLLSFSLLLLSPSFLLLHPSHIPPLPLSFDLSDNEQP